MEKIQNKKFTPVECQKCDHQDGEVILNISVKETDDDLIVVEEYMRCPNCGNLTGYFKEIYDSY